MICDLRGSARSYEFLYGPTLKAFVLRVHMRHLRVVVSESVLQHGGKVAEDVG